MILLKLETNDTDIFLTSIDCALCYQSCRFQDYWKPFGNDIEYINNHTIRYVINGVDYGIGYDNLDKNSDRLLSTFTMDLNDEYCLQ